MSIEYNYFFVGIKIHENAKTFHKSKRNSEEIVSRMRLKID